MTRRLVRTFVSLSLACVLIAGMARASQAATVTSYACTVAAVTYDGAGLYVDCVGGPTRFANWPGRCSYGNPTSDTIKIWDSLATAALLSGKTLTISWVDTTTCPQVNGSSEIVTLAISR